MRDDPQGKRYGRRGADKRIIEAYGFDLSLATRYEEFVRLAAEAQIERTRAKALRKRKTIARPSPGRRDPRQPWREPGLVRTFH